MTKAVVMVMCLWESVKVTMGELLRKHISNLSSTSSDYRTALNVLIKYEIQCLVWTPLLNEMIVTEIKCNISQWFIRILCPYNNTQEWLVWSNDYFLKNASDQCNKTCFQTVMCIELIRVFKIMAGDMFSLYACL